MENKLARLKEFSFGLKMVLVVSLIAFAFNLITQFQWFTMIDGIKGAINIGIFSSLLGLFLIGLFGTMYEDAGKGEVPFQFNAWKKFLSFLYYHYKMHPRLSFGIYLLISMPLLYFYAFFMDILNAYYKWGDDIWLGSGSSIGYYSWSDIEYMLGWLFIFLILTGGMLICLYVSKQSTKPILHKIIAFVVLIGYWALFWFFAFARSRY